LCISLKASTLGDPNDSLCPIDQEERGLPTGFGGGSTNGPQDGLEVV
jgi:hypothetical protein